MKTRPIFIVDSDEIIKAQIKSIGEGVQLLENIIKKMDEEYQKRRDETCQRSFSAMDHHWENIRNRLRELGAMPANYREKEDLIRWDVKNGLLLFVPKEQVEKDICRDPTHNHDQDDGAFPIPGPGNGVFFKGTKENIAELLKNLFDPPT